MSAANPAGARPRAKEPLVAVLLSFLAAGLGHLYAGHPLRGAGIMLTVAGSITAALRYVWNPALHVHPAIALGLPALIVFGIAVVIDAYRCARCWNARHGALRELSGRRRLALTAAIVLVWLLPGPVDLIAAYVRVNVMQTFAISGRAMEPVLQDGDRVFVDKRAYRTAAPKRGDIIALRRPGDLRRAQIKRVVGLPGEMVEIREGRLLIDGAPPADSPLVAGLAYANTGAFGAAGKRTQVPGAAYFVLGDHSAASEDSRHWGTVEGTHVLGKAVKIFYPFDRSGPVEPPQ